MTQQYVHCKCNLCICLCSPYNYNIIQIKFLFNAKVGLKETKTDLLYINIAKSFCMIKHAVHYTSRENVIAVHVTKHPGTLKSVFIKKCNAAITMEISITSNT